MLKKCLFYASLALAVWFSPGCNKCDDVACFSPPAALYLQLVDKDSGEDLVANGSIDAEAVKIFSLSGNKYHELQFSTSDSLNYIFTDAEIGWNLGADNSAYELRLGDAKTLPFIYESRQKTADCCTWFEVQRFEVGSITPLLIPEQNLFQLKI